LKKIQFFLQFQQHGLDHVRETLLEAEVHGEFFAILYDPSKCLPQCPELIRFIYLFFSSQLLPFWKLGISATGRRLLSTKDLFQIKMPSLSTRNADQKETDYDLIVLGGGSGSCFSVILNVDAAER
jgi:hypothetical protein